MAISHRIDPEKLLMLVTIVGPTDPVGFASTIDQLMVDPGLRPGMGLLCDFTRVEGVATLEIAHECVRAAARLAARIGPFRAAVVNSRDANFGITNAAIVFARSVPGIEMAGFRNLEKAERWLSEPTA